MARRSQSPGITRRAMLQGLAAVGIGTATGTVAHGFMYQRHHVEVTHTKIPLSHLPDALEGLKIGFVSDLHRSPTVPHELIDAAVRALLAEQPDIIALGGDYVTWGNRRYVEPAAEALAPLTAPHGVFAVLGNHDDEREMSAALADRGFAVLRDQRTQLTIRGEKLDFVGIRYWTRRLGEVEQIARGASPIAVLLAHTPMRAYEASELRMPLLLSGHTHGGQIVLPGIGPLGARKYPIVAGIGYRGPTTVFVTRGVGTVYVPARVNCPPEVAILTLSRASNQARTLL
jgi:predicted MPP superfamily phosphohydrolase